MSSFIERKYKMALDLLSVADGDGGVFFPCSTCCYNDHEWCRNHCNKDTTPDYECYDKYFNYELRDEIRKKLGANESDNE